MSRAGLRVAFPDGTVRCGIFQGTSDVCDPWLYDTDSEAWEDNRPSSRDYSEAPVGKIFSVLIYSDYADGFWWVGQSAKNVIVSGRDPFEEDLPETDGMPLQVKEFYAEQERIYESKAGTS